MSYKVKYGGLAIYLYIYTYVQKLFFVTNIK